MHRLRKGKKKEDEEGIPPVPQPAPTTSHNPFKWGRTPEPPPKPELDLEHALPASDDFRTSLLMPNLAQRFSILQQEMAAAAAAAAANGGINPNAPIGTAIDGMDGFVFTNPPQFTPMGEITETSSIAEGTSSQQNRLTTKSEESVSSEDSGGIMNRSRGGEGNVLFGGRQKVYRVPNAYTSGKDSMDDSSPNPGAPMGGRSVGSHDIPDGFGMAKNRRDHHESEEANGVDDYNKNRNTSSSTGSDPTTITRSSTAATSVASNRSPSSTTQASMSTSSPPVAPIATKPRKALYEQALDQQLQDQQTTAVGRLERLASLRKAAVSPPPANSYQGSFSPPGLFQQSNAPPSLPTSPKQTPQWSINLKKIPDSPMSMPEADEGEQDNEETVKQTQKLGQSLSPHMAQFNFGLEPRSQSPISPPVSASAIQFPTQGPFSPGILSRDQPQRNPNSDKSNLQMRTPSPLNDLKTTLSIRSSASDSSYEEENDGMDSRTSPVSRNSLDNIAPLHPRKNFAHSTDSEHVEVEPPSPVSPVSPISPIFSSRISDDFMRPNQPLRNPAISPTSPKFSADVHPSSDDDSPTLPPDQGLSMLVRQHLRTDSGHSSVYAGSTYTRMSRVSNYGPAATPSKNIKESDAQRPSASGASGSSGGNLWEFDDWDGGYYEEARPGMGSTPPTTSDNLPTPAIPPKDSRRTSSEERRENEHITRERERSRGRADSRMSERDRAMSRASERDTESPAGEDDKDWEQQLAFRRQIIQQNLRNHEKVNSQHELDFSLDTKGQQGKNGGSGGGFGVLRSKGSNGIISKNDPSRSGRDSPGPGMRKEGSRSRMNSSEAERRTEEERRLRETVRGPKNIPPGGYPTQQHPPHSYHHIPPPNPARLNTNLNDNRPKPRSPVGLPHPLHSPIITPRPRQKSIRDQRNDGRNNGEQNTQRGQPMGWRDDEDTYIQPRSAPGTQPGSPVSQRDGHHGIRKQPSMPRMGGQDMYMGGQGQSRDQEPRRNGGHPPVSGMNYSHSNMNQAPTSNGLSKKQSFDRDGQPHGSEFRRPRGNSNASSGPTMRQRRGTFDNSPLPPLNTAALSPPTQHLQSSSTPNSAIAVEHSPAFSQTTQTPTSGSAITTPASAVSAKSPPAALIQTIANSNAGFAPAKKRVVDKSKIGDPKLISSTSNIPTVDLPAQITPPLGSGKEKDGRKRRMTETRSIFSGFGRNKSSEEVPALPTGSPMMPRHHTDDEVERSSFTDMDPPPSKGKKTGGKLRKSTSDGGALSARARKEALARSPMVPKLPKGMEVSGVAPAGMI